MPPIAGSRTAYELPSVCVVGAGPSGLTASKALQDRGIPFECFEQGDRIGGLWAFGNQGGNPGAYRSLSVNTSKARVELEDLPMPADVAEFPSHGEIAAYLESYADRFRLRARISLRTLVSRADPVPDGTWRVSLGNGEVRHYDALVVASGHHWDPLWPDPPPPGSFEGEQLHARDYVDANRLEGQSVVVVGLGNSAVDIAVDVSRTAARTILSVRRGAHILPRTLFGRPIDQLELLVPERLRPALGGPVAGLALRAGYRLGRIRRPQDHGLPTPEQPLGATQPTVSPELLDLLGAGTIIARPQIEQLAGGEVVFGDGSHERADAIIWCTGYRVTLPFLDPSVASAPGNVLPLFHRVFMPGRPGLYFIGLAQPIGPTIRLVESQSKWLAAHLAGEYALPTRQQVEREIAAEQGRITRRYVPSPRHTMQVDYWPYLQRLRRELRRGRRRAARRGYAPPLPARAQRPALPVAASRGAPSLSVVLPVDDLGKARGALQALGAQTVADRIELVLVGAAVAEEQPGEDDPLSSFHSVSRVAQPFHSLPEARARGVSAAAADVVAFAETHCYPEPRWAEALIATHLGRWAAVGPEVANENPTRTSQAGMLINYGSWASPARPGAAADLPGHNSSYKRVLLIRYGSDLARVLGAESVLHWDLGEQGHAHYLQPAARVRHRNIDRLGPALAEHFHGSRAFAAGRAARWRLPLRLAYALGAPLIPPVRFLRILNPGRGRTSARPTARMYPTIICLLISGAAGEMVGYLGGAGKSPGQLVPFELDRDRWLRARPRDEARR